LDHEKEKPMVDFAPLPPPVLLANYAHVSDNTEKERLTFLVITVSIVVYIVMSQYGRRKVCLDTDKRHFSVTLH
jgi:hypothetical protein